MKSDDCIFSNFFRIGFNILPSAPHLFRPFQRNCPNYRPCLIFRNTSIFYNEEFVDYRPSTQDGGSPRLCCPWLLIRSICSYPAYRRPFPPPENLGLSVPS